MKMGGSPFALNGHHLFTIALSPAFSGLEIFWCVDPGLTPQVYASASSAG